MLLGQERRRVAAMKQRREVVGLVLLCCISQGFSLVCFACFPDVNGDSLSRYEAVNIRANISRTYEDRSYATFGLCSNLSMASHYQVVCPGKNPNIVCMTISNDYWTASTCGHFIMPVGASMVCNRKGHLEYCYCNADLCNDALRVSSSQYLLLMASLLAWKVIDWK